MPGAPHEISEIEVIPIRAPECREVAEADEFLVTPLHIFPDYRRMLGQGFVGLRGGPVGAVLVRVTTRSGAYGVGSAGVGETAAPFTSCNTSCGRWSLAPTRSMSRFCGSRCFAPR